MIKMEFSFPDLTEKFKAHRKDILMVLAATMQTNRARMFDQEGADNGKAKWAPLKWRQGMILSKRGTLRKSFGPPNDGHRPGTANGSIIRYQSNKTTIGSDLLYARMMNDGTTKLPGGVLRATRAKALKIPAPKGINIEGVKDGFLFRKSVKIPARPMDEQTQEDAQEYADTMAIYIAEVLNG